MLPALTYLLICTILLTLPGSAIPKENWLDRIWMDKWVHLGMFLILVFAWCRYYSKKGKAKATVFWAITILSITYGVTMEFVQHYLVPHRSYDAGDMIADAAGSLIGLGIATRVYIKK